MAQKRHTDEETAQHSECHSTPLGGDVTPSAQQFTISVYLTARLTYVPPLRTCGPGGLKFKSPTAR